MTDYVDYKGNYQQVIYYQLMMHWLLMSCNVMSMTLHEQVHYRGTLQYKSCVTLVHIPCL